MNKNGIFSKSLNNTGFFLELAFLDFANNYEPFITETQVPFTNNWSGMEPINGVMDFLCLYLKTGRPLVYYSIECKKADPSRKEWVFFKRNEDEAESILFYKNNNAASPKVIKGKIIYSPICDRGIQIVGSKPTSPEYNINKDPIYNSAIQAQNGIKYLIYKEGYQGRALENYGSGANNVIYVPIVITTADLYVYKTNFCDLDISKGSVDENKAEFEQKNWIEYSLPVPEYLQIKGADRNSVFIINSNYVKDFFDNIISHLKIGFIS